MTSPITRLPGDPSPGMLRLIRNTGHLLLFLTLGMNLTLGLLHYTFQDDGVIVEPAPVETGSFWDDLQRGPQTESWQLILAHFAAGRAASVGLGLQQGFSPIFLLILNVMLDTMLMCYCYPLFVVGYRKLVRVPLLGAALESTNDLAYKYKDRIAPYGVIGLMLFTLFPLWSTGPLVGVVLGYIIGLRTWLTFASVTLGNTLAVAIWIWFYNWLHGFSGQLALALLILLFAVAAIGLVYKRTQKRELRADDGEAPEEDAEPEVAGMLERTDAGAEAAQPSAPAQEKPAPEGSEAAENMPEAAAATVETPEIKTAPRTFPEPPSDPESSADFFGNMPGEE